MDLRGWVEEAERDELPRVYGQLHEALALVQMRMQEGAGAPPPLTTSTEALVGEEDLTYDDLARRLKVSVSYLQTLVRQRKIPFTRMPASDSPSGRRREGRGVRFNLAEVKEAIRKLSRG